MHKGQQHGSRAQPVSPQKYQRVLSDGQHGCGGGLSSPREKGLPPHGSGFLLMEGLPQFFLETNPSTQQLEAFRAFSEKASAIRQEVVWEDATRATDRDSSEICVASPTQANFSPASQTVHSSSKVGAKALAPALSQDELPKASADATAAPTAGDAYPEVPELAGSTRLLRFLQGFDFDVSVTSEAYRRHLKWRVDVGLNARRRREVVESLLLPMRPEAAPRHEEVSQFYPMNPLLRKEVKDVCSGETLAAAAAAASAPGDGDSLLKVLTDEALDAVLLDTRGNIITIERPGQLDVNGLFASVTEEEFLRWHTHILEFRCMLLDVLSRKFKRMVRITSIIDLQGLSARILSRRALNLLRRTIGAASENYPESIGSMFFINTPKTFSTIWSALRGCLRERTINKITLLGNDAESVLVSNIGGYALPPSLGGNCTSALGDVPLRAEDRETDLGPGSLILHVGARRCNQAVASIPEKSTAQWVWVVEDFDVGFSAVWRSQSGHENVLAEHRKYPARKRVSGVFESKQEGTLILAFDNSWGLISPRRVRYKIDVVPCVSAETQERDLPAASSVQ